MQKKLLNDNSNSKKYLIDYIPKRNVYLKEILIRM